MKSIINEAGKKIMNAEETIKEPHSSCCVLWNLPHDLASEVIEFGKNTIDTDDLAVMEDGDDPLETNIHITVLFGIEDNSEIGNIRKIAKSHKPIIVEFGNLSLFENDNDVLKIEVKSKGLIKLHKEIRAKIPNTWSHDDYNPHITIAYLKSGTGKKYTEISDTEMPLHGKSALITSFVLVDQQDTKHIVDMGPPTDEDKSFIEEHYDGPAFRFLCGD